MSTSPNTDRGFTLIEVLIAMCILTVALVSIAELMAKAIRNIHEEASVTSLFV